MQSLTNRFSEIQIDLTHPQEFGRLSELESAYYRLKNENAQLVESNDQLKHELNEFQKNDEYQLSEISRKLKKEFKNLGEEKMLSKLVLMRSKILDHFTLAYIAELGCKPSEAKLIQEPGPDGVELYFEKKTNIILPKGV